MTTEVITGLIVVGSILGSGWGAHEYLQGRYATREAVELAGGKVDILLDARLELLIEQRAKLAEKKNKSSEDLRHLEYLNKQIDYLRAVQRGQVK